MKYDKIALFTDLDGTLLNGRRQVSDENLQALARFTAEGGLFGISTGRAPSNALDVLPPLPINTWSVFLNGAES
ncbi:MAG: HAD hydrolase family protein, partial [Oscillospiraceae bacterium]|nr:HAD hydrolase family protein [Oscillospiraceae bacterium]